MVPLVMLVVRAVQATCQLMVTLVMPMVRVLQVG